MNEWPPRAIAQGELRIEIRAEHIEEALVEDKARPGGEIRGGCHDKRHVFALQIGKSRAVKQDFIIVLRGKFRSPPAGRRQARPVQGIEHPGDDFALHIALQEAPFIAGKELFAVQAVGQRREAAARYAGDHIHFVQQSDLQTLRPEQFGSPQKLEHAKRKRGSARATTRKRQHDQVFPIAFLGVHALEQVAVFVVDRMDRGIDWARGAADKHQRCEPR